MKHIYNSIPNSECAEYFFNINDVVAVKCNRYYSGSLGWAILKDNVLVPIDDKKLLEICIKKIKNDEK